jgi:mannose PTS system EIID component
MRVPPRTLARVFWRCLFLQAAWNRRGMQNLGFAYAIDPALRVLYPEPALRKEALRRHLGFFNCHPYTAAAIVGGAIHHEERVASGEEAGMGPQAYKATLQGPLAAIGDGFFWTALRPFFGALAALGTLLVGWPAVVAALAVYNAIHLALRIRLFRSGYLLGDAIVGEVASMSLPPLAEMLRIGAAVLAGLSAAIVASRGAVRSGGGAGVVAVVAAVLGYVALSKGARLLPAAYAIVALGAGAALAAASLHGGP